MPIFDFVCIQCKNSFQRNLHQRDIDLGRGKFCSRKCKGLNSQRATMMTCHFCDKKFKCHASRIKNGFGKYCSFSCRSKDKTGEKSPSFRNGTYITIHGYIAYSRKDGKKSVLQHRVFMEEKIGRKLLPHEVVHHINGIKTDNRIENLELVTVFTHHHHHLITTWSRRFDKCIKCGTTTIPHGSKGQCSKCYKAEWYQSHKSRGSSS